MDCFDPKAARAAGTYPERIEHGLLLPTFSTLTWTGPGSESSETGTQTGAVQQGKSSPAATAIMGGVIGVLACMVVVGVGTWYFRRTCKAHEGEVNKDHSDYPGHLDGALTSSGRGMQPRHLRPYVSDLALLLGLLLINGDRTLQTQEPSPAESTQVFLILVVSLELRSYVRPDEVLVSTQVQMER